MRKLFAAAILAFICQGRAHATPLDFQYVAGLSGTSSSAVLISTPSATTQNCIDHVTVTSTNAAHFSMILSQTTTGYQVLLSSGVPYDTQWNSHAPYCAPAGNSLTLSVDGGLYVISYEGFTYKGRNP